MNPLQAVLSAFYNYSNFDGRACRSEYWWFYLFFVIWLVGIFVVSVAWFPVLLILWVIYLIVMAPPLWAVTVRRLHDQNRSGRWALLGFLPLAGGPRMTRLLAMPGTVGPNRYGPDPLRPELGGWTQRPVHSAVLSASRPQAPKESESFAHRRCSRCGWSGRTNMMSCSNCGAAL